MEERKAQETPPWAQGQNHHTAGARGFASGRGRRRTTCRGGDWSGRRGDATTTEGARPAAAAASEDRLGRGGARAAQPITGPLSGDVGRARRFGAPVGVQGRAGRGSSDESSSRGAWLRKPRGGLAPACCLALRSAPAREARRRRRGGSLGPASGESRASAGPRGEHPPGPAPPPPAPPRGLSSALRLRRAPGLVSRGPPRQGPSRVPSRRRLGLVGRQVQGGSRAGTLGVGAGAWEGGRA